METDRKPREDVVNISSTIDAAHSALTSSVVGVLLLSSAAARADHPSVTFDGSTVGPITTIPARTLPRDGLAVGLRVDQLNLDAFSDAELEQLASAGAEVHSSDALLVTSLGVSYGLTEDLTLGLRLPYVRRTNIREAEDAGGGLFEVEPHGDSSGIGDITLLGKYQIIHSLRTGYDFSVLFGIKVPTGATDRTTLEGDRFETEHQPGSGSWDPLLGFALGTSTGPFGFDVSLLYASVSKGSQDTDLGDRFFYNASLSYRLRGAASHEHDQGASRHDNHSHRSWDLVLELNGEWQARQTISGVEDPNSGGNVIYLSPGLRFNPGDAWAAGIALGVPVVQDLNGFQHEADWRVVFGLGRAI